MLDYNKPVTTRDGREARLYDTDIENNGGRYPLHGAVLSDEAGAWYPMSWRADGHYAADTEVSNANDLVNIPEYRWLNIYHGGHDSQSDCDPAGKVYKSREEADKVAGSMSVGGGSLCRAACIKFLIGQDDK